MPPNPKSFPTTHLPTLTQLVRGIASTAAKVNHNQRLRCQHSTAGGMAAATSPPSTITTIAMRPYPPNIPPPSTIQSECLHATDRCCVLNDAYPKSVVHCLVTPLDTSLQSLNDLRTPLLLHDDGRGRPGTTCTIDHMPLLLHMKATAEAYVQFLKLSCPSHQRRNFIMGFHAIPSLPMLHMHAMSMDLDSPRMKKKHHYNSFATHFFISIDAVIADLATNGFVTLNQDVEALEALVKQPLRCLWCGTEAFTQMPALKAHLERCPANRSLVPAG